MISFRAWVGESVRNLRESGRSLPARLFRPAYYVFVAVFLTITRSFPYGTNIFDHDWDLLIILDACRIDAIEAVADEYDFLKEVSSVRSLGSTSFEWMTNTFRTEYTEKIMGTAMITQNVYTERVLGQAGYTGHAAIPFGPTEYDVVSTDDFAYLEECWRVDDTDVPDWVIGKSDSQRISPEYLTDRVIRAARNTNSDRIIAHYMFPHDPFPLADIPIHQLFENIRNGTMSRDEAMEVYLDNLRLVLDAVELLLKNVDARTVVITADHGEAFGEWGFYKHVIACPISEVREVPWVMTTASDSGEYEPVAPGADHQSETSAEQRLEELGYL